MPELLLGKIRITPKGAYDSETPYGFYDTITTDDNSKLWLVLQDVEDVTPINDGVNYILLLDAGDATAHIANMSNPHGVSIDQIATDTEYYENTLSGSGTLDATLIDFDGAISARVKTEEVATLSVSHAETAGDATTLGGYTDEQIAKTSYNAMRNPDCSINQRAIVSSTDSGDFIVDGWSHIISVSGGASTCESSQVIHQNSHCIKMTGNVSGGGGAEQYSISQKIEINKYSAEATVASFDVYASESGTIQVFIQNNYGSGGSSASTRFYDSVDLSAGYNKVSIPLAVVDYTSKNIGSNPYIVVYIYKQIAGDSINYTGDLQLTNFKLGYTSIFNAVDKDSELTKCLRFLPIITLGDSYVQVAEGFGETATEAYVHIRLDRPLRRALVPSDLVYSGTFRLNGNATFHSVASIEIATTLSTLTLIVLKVTVSTGTVVNDATYRLNLHGVASLLISQEL